MIATMRKVRQIIKEPVEVPTKEEAARMLRACGVLDENNKLMPAFKDILYMEESVDEVD